MARATFETIEGEEVEINSEEVIRLMAGATDGTTVIEMEDGEEIVVAATQIEVAAELDLDPLEYVSVEEVDKDLPDDFDGQETP